jgi:hypothetical protein
MPGRTVIVVFGLPTSVAPGTLKQGAAVRAPRASRIVVAGLAGERRWQRLQRGLGCGSFQFFGHVQPSSSRMASKVRLFLSQTEARASPVREGPIAAALVTAFCGPRLNRGRPRAGRILPRRHAASGSGPRCSLPAFMRSLGTVQSFAHRSISDHKAPGTSPRLALSIPSRRVQIRDCDWHAIGLQATPPTEYGDEQALVVWTLKTIQLLPRSIEVGRRQQLDRHGLATEAREQGRGSPSRHPIRMRASRPRRIRRAIFRLAAGRCNGSACPALVFRR